MAVGVAEFAQLNLMAGTARSLEQAPASDEDRRLWDRDFDLLVNDLIRLVDPEIGNDLRSEKSFYTGALQVAKGYFNDKPFGGLKPSTGQFGFRLLGPQDLKTTAAGGTPKYYSWAQTVTTDSAATKVAYLFGHSSGKVFARNASETKAVIAFHRILSYKPAPKVLLVEWNVNDYPYAPYSVEPFSKIAKDGKLYKVIPMPGRVLLHPGGGFYTHFFFDLETGATAPTGTKNIDVELALIGVVFGEYDYLATAALT